MGTWDNLMKLLVRAKPHDFMALVWKEAQYVSQLPTELKVRTIDADVLIEAQWQDGGKVILHTEFQLRRDTTMDRRVWEYNVQTDCLMKAPVYSVVVYLRPDGQISEPCYQRVLPDGEVIHYFKYKAIELWKITAEDLKKNGHLGMFPLLPLTKDGARQEVVDEMMTTLYEADEQDLLLLGYAFASQVLEKKTEKAWLKRRFEQMHEVLEESWVYQEIIEKGLNVGIERGIKQGLERGLEQGLIQGRVEELRSMLTRYVGKRFPALTSLARHQVTFLATPEELEVVLDQLYDVQTVDEARKILTSVQEFPETTS